MLNNLQVLDILDVVLLLGRRRNRAVDATALLEASLLIMVIVCVQKLARLVDVLNGRRLISSYWRILLKLASNRK